MLTASSGASKVVRRWHVAFRLVGHRRVGGRGHKTSAGDETTWFGALDGLPFLLRIRPRPRIEGEHFMTSSNHRLRASKLGQAGYFLDVEVLRGPTRGPAAEQLARFIVAVDEASPPAGGGRPARLRAAGESFRSGALGDDALATATNTIAWPAGTPPGRAALVSSDARRVRGRNARGIALGPALPIGAVSSEKNR